MYINPKSLTNPIINPHLRLLIGFTTKTNDQLINEFGNSYWNDWPDKHGHAATGVSRQIWNAEERRRMQRTVLKVHTKLLGMSDQSAYSDGHQSLPVGSSIVL